MIKKALTVTVQIILLWVIYLTGEWIVQFFHLPLPGNVMGMVLLFSLLMSGMVKEEWVSAGGGLLLKHLAFFFIPIAVGLMEWGDLFLSKGWWLFVTIAASTLVALATTGGVVQVYDRKEEKSHG